MISQLEQAVSLLNDILAARLDGVIRYTQYSLTASGRDRFTFSNFFTAQTNRSLRQAQETGQILMALNERPRLSSNFSGEPSRQSTREMLLRSLNYERQLLVLHRQLLHTVQTHNIALEEFSMRQLLASESVCQQLSQMLSELESSVCIHA